MTEPSRGTAFTVDLEQQMQPFLKHLQFPPLTTGDGTARLEFVVAPIHLRLGGVVHGGVFASVMDSVTGYAAYTVAPEGAGVLTMQLNLNMTATAKLGDRLVAASHVMHFGRRTAVVSGEIRRADGKLLATGSATLMFVTEGVAS